MPIDYIRYLLKRKNEYSLHSPFVFDFYTQVIINSKKKFDIDSIEDLKKCLLKSDEELDIEDYGAGSRFTKNNKRKLSSIAKHALKSSKWAKIIAETAHFLRANTVLELGTSLGITSSYLAMTNPYCKIYTLEGCPNTLKKAKLNFEELNIYNVVPVLGNIDLVLTEVLPQINKLDLVIFDANHRYDPTISYFHKCLAYAHDKTCFVFDDINWSKGMKKAWQEIKEHPDVSISIDFYEMGFVFLKKDITKQNFILKS